MERQDKQRFSPPAVGGTSLLVVFAVLCLTVFALLSLATVRSDTGLADVSQRAVEEYYAADLQAQEILARLRAGETPEGVKLMGGDTLYAEYVCPISDTKELQVSVALTPADGGMDYEILRWQAAASGEWESDEFIGIWDGTLF